jgi:hypothetical protein
MRPVGGPIRTEGGLRGPPTDDLGECLRSMEVGFVHTRLQLAERDMAQRNERYERRVAMSATTKSRPSTRDRRAGKRGILRGITGNYSTLVRLSRSENPSTLSESATLACPSVSSFLWKPLTCGLRGACLPSEVAAPRGDRMLPYKRPLTGKALE